MAATTEYQQPPSKEQLARGQSYAKYPRPFADSRFIPVERQNPLYRILSIIGLFPPDPLHDKIPVKTGKVPIYHELTQCLHIYPAAVIPLVIRAVYQSRYGENPSPFLMWSILALTALMFGLSMIHRLNRMTLKYGYFDGAVLRDTVPKQDIMKVLVEVLGGVTLRPLFIVFLTYKQNQESTTLTPWLPLQLFFFTLIEDFYYYWLHRMCHEVSTMWQFHRMHHTTKHPTQLLLGYADEIQEIFDLVIVPVMAWLTYPIDFDSLSIWFFIHLSIQLHGHSGIRIYHGTVLTGIFLRPIGLELISEDHDIHHRFGWRNSCNYGKQSNVWDTLFGTRGERIECKYENVDFSNHA